MDFRTKMLAFSKATDKQRLYNKAMGGGGEKYTEQELKTTSLYALWSSGKHGDRILHITARMEFAGMVNAQPNLAFDLVARRDLSHEEMVHTKKKAEEVHEKQQRSWAEQQKEMIVSRRRIIFFF